jgi:hypothetical protein
MAVISERQSAGDDALLLVGPTGDDRHPPLQPR